jgi:hypothetical protein
MYYYPSCLHYQYNNVVYCVYPIYFIANSQSLQDHEQYQAVEVVEPMLT